MADEQIQKHGSSNAADTFTLVRGVVILVIGVGILIYALVPPIQPVLLTSGGALIGMDPMLRSAN
jgi:hypothetical protein